MSRPEAWSPQEGDTVRYRRSGAVHWQVTYVSPPGFSDGRIGVMLERLPNGTRTGRPRFDVDSRLLEPVR